MTFTQQTLSQKVTVAYQLTKFGAKRGLKQFDFQVFEFKLDILMHSKTLPNNN